MLEVVIISCNNLNLINKNCKKCVTLSKLPRLGKYFIKFDKLWICGYFIIISVTVFNNRENAFDKAVGPLCGR